MTSEEIIDRMQKARCVMNAVELAHQLEELLGVTLSQSLMTSYFQRAFRDVPLRVIIRAGRWDYVSGGGLNDEQLNTLLVRWLPG